MNFRQTARRSHYGMAVSEIRDVCILISEKFEKTAGEFVKTTPEEIISNP